MNKYNDLPGAPSRVVCCHACNGNGYITPWNRSARPYECELCQGTGRVEVRRTPRGDRGPKGEG